MKWYCFNKRKDFSKHVMSGKMISLCQSKQNISLDRIIQFCHTKSIICSLILFLKLLKAGKIMMLGLTKMIVLSDVTMWFLSVKTVSFQQSYIGNSVLISFDRITGFLCIKGIIAIVISENMMWFAWQNCLILFENCFWQSKRPSMSYNTKNSGSHTKYNFTRGTSRY